MGLYATRPGRFVGQLLGDVFALAWSVVWGFVAVFVHGTVAVLATPARETARTAGRLASDFRDAAGQAATVPGVGDELRRPFDAAAVTLGTLIGAANRQVDSIERLALIVGWLVFLLPVSLVLAFWVPRRVRFWRQARASQHFLDAQPDLDLFALRALASQPLSVLATVSDDPVRAWRDGDRAVVNRLAEIELRRSGLRLPPSLRAQSGLRTIEQQEAAR